MGIVKNDYHEAARNLFVPALVTDKNLEVVIEDGEETAVIDGKDIPIFSDAFDLRIIQPQNGNSNPYCIDSQVTWLDWRKDAFARELTAFTQSLIAFRREHPLLRSETEQMVSGGAGSYPAFSCHSSRAWYASGEYQDRHIGLMFCGQEQGEDRYLYAAFNLHWEEREFALPYLPEGMCWKEVISTGVMDEAEHCRTLTLPGRTVVLLEGKG